jgi:hypothetical protein
VTRTATYAAHTLSLDSSIIAPPTGLQAKPDCLERVVTTVCVSRSLTETSALKHVYQHGVLTRCHLDWQAVQVFGRRFESSTLAATNVLFLKFSPSPPSAFLIAKKSMRTTSSSKVQDARSLLEEGGIDCGLNPKPNPINLISVTVVTRCAKVRQDLARHIKMTF